MKLYLSAATILILPFFPITILAATDPNANDPNMERYCDPAVNADVFSQIKKYEDQIATLPKDDPKRFANINEISKLTLKIKCSYRTKKQ